MAEKCPIVVIIDDSATSISFYELSTKSLIVDLKTFQSPAQSLEYLGTHPADLVFLDILMKEMDGLGVLKKLREMDLHQDTAVVMVTSKDYAQDRTHAKELGARDFLVKPLRSQEIKEVVRKYTGAQVIDNETGPL